MNIIVDTHILLWALAEPLRIPAASRRRLEDPDSTVLFSAASIWELAIKLQLRRIDLPVGPDDVATSAERMGFRELPVTAAHAAGVHRLPLHHRDPFDRILVAQALHEPAHLLTADRALLEYSDLVQFAE